MKTTRRTVLGWLLAAVICPPKLEPLVEWDLQAGISAEEFIKWSLQQHMNNTRKILSEKIIFGGEYVREEQWNGPATHVSLHPVQETTCRSKRRPHQPRAPHRQHEGRDA